eukprot:403359853
MIENSSQPDNLEEQSLRQGVSFLLENLYSTYQQETLSLKFKDEIIEKEFQNILHKRVNYYAWLYLIEYILALTNFHALFIYNIVRDGFTMGYIYMWIGTIVTILLQIILLQQTKKRIKLALIFADIQTMILVVFIFEMSSRNQPEGPEVDAFTVCMAFIATLSVGFGLEVIMHISDLYLTSGSLLLSYI